MRDFIAKIACPGAAKKLCYLLPEDRESGLVSARRGFQAERVDLCHLIS
jgi:hypothetical protein